MSDDNTELIRMSGLERRMPETARISRFVGVYKTLYDTLLAQTLREFPPIEGYETMHMLLSERLVYFFVKQKHDESEPNQLAIDPKVYKLNIAAFLRTAEGMLKEARSISAEVTFKHNFVRQVMEVIDRCVGDQALKSFIAKELDKVVNL